LTPIWAAALSINASPAMERTHRAILEQSSSYSLTECAFFVFGFAKYDLDNISADELEDYKAAARITLVFDEAARKNLIEQKQLTGVRCDGVVQK